jgi:hypothetical protein
MTRSTHARRSRFDDLTDAEIQARWRALKPVFLKWLILCALAAPAMFVLHHYWQPGKPMADILSVAFRIAVGGVGLFAFLVCMALFFSRPKSARK